MMTRDNRNDASIPANPRRGEPWRQGGKTSRALVRVGLVMALNGALMGLAAQPAAAGVRPHKPARIAAHLYGPPMRVVLIWSRSYRAGAYRLFRNGHLLAKHLYRARYVDSSVRRARTYFYSAEACNSWGCSAPSFRVKVRTPRHAPRVPTSVRVGTSGSARVTVRWQGSRAAIRYRVFKEGHLVARRVRHLWYQDSRVRPNLAYGYSVTACNAAGCSSRSRRITVVVGDVPAAPNGITAAPDGSAQVALRWRPAWQAMKYRLYRNGNLVAPRITTTTHMDAPLLAATTYTYSVRACNGAGCSAASPTVTARTPFGKKPNTPPSPAGVWAAPNDTSHVTVGWKVVRGATQYWVLRDGNPIASGVSGTSYRDGDANSSTTYSYKVAACNSKGCSSPSGAASARTPGPPAPDATGVTASVDSGHVTIGWNGDSDATGYRVYRNGALLASVSQPGYVDGAVAPSTLYFYTVTACGVGGCSVPGRAAAVKVPGPPASCSGVSVSPTPDLRSVVSSKPPGTTFCLAAGIYPLDAGVLVKSNDTFVGEPGAVLDGGGAASSGLYGYGTDTGQKNVTVQGLTFRRFAGRAVKAGWNWTIEDNEMSNSAVGVSVSSGSVLRHNYIHDNTQYGISGGPASNILIVGNEVAHNNTSNGCGGACAGDAAGSKIVGSTPGTYGVTWRANWVHDNIGVGIWSDGNVHGAVYENNLVEDNTGIGIFHEISWDATVRNNVLFNNDSVSVGKSCWWGAQIHVNNSQNIQVYGNTVSSSNGANGICGADVVRDNTSPYPTALANLSVHDNALRLTGHGVSGFAGNHAYNISFDLNQYHVHDLAAKHWDWYSASPLSWSQFTSKSQEPHGSPHLDR